jgi:hypothetical protein
LAASEPATASCDAVEPGYRSLVRTEPGLSAYWPLGDATGLVACDVAGGRHGTYAGAFLVGQSSALGGGGTGAVFTGGGWVRVAAHPALSPAHALTLEAWVQPSSVSRSQTVVRKDGEYLLRLAGDRAVLRIWSTDGVVELSAPRALQAGVFQHLAGVFDGTALRIYVDGRAVAARAAEGTLQATKNPLYLASSWSEYDFLEGALDDVALYATPLSAAALADHAAAARPGGASVSCGYGAFAADRWPTACWRPYGSASPFNRPLPSEPPVTTDSDRVVARLLSSGPPDHLVVGAGEDHWHPTYYSQPTDPSFTLRCYESAWGRCEIEGLRIRVPEEARPAAGSDAHLTVVDQAEGWEYDLYKVRSKPAGGGTLEFRWGGRTRIGGDGLGSDATAARFGSLAGIIRASELAAGHIDHALFMVARCDAGRFVYPALKSGRSCAMLGEAVEDAPPMGARLQLALSSDEIDALDVPRWKKTILRAMSRYGLILGDTGGGTWGIQAESGATYTSFGRPDPLVDFAAANDWTRIGDAYIGDLGADVDWSKLRVIDPCVSRDTC